MRTFCLRYQKQEMNSASTSEVSFSLEKPLLECLEEIAMERHKLALEKGRIRVSQWIGHSVRLIWQNGHWSFLSYLWITYSLCSLDILVMKHLKLEVWFAELSDQLVSLFYCLVLFFFVFLIYSWGFFILRHLIVCHFFLSTYFLVVPFFWIQKLQGGKWNSEP